MRNKKENQKERQAEHPQPPPGEEFCLWCGCCPIWMVSLSHIDPSETLAVLQALC